MTLTNEQLNKAIEIVTTISINYEYIVNNYNDNDEDITDNSVTLDYICEYIRKFEKSNIITELAEDLVMYDEELLQNLFIEEYFEYHNFMMIESFDLNLVIDYLKTLNIKKTREEKIKKIDSLSC